MMKKYNYREILWTTDPDPGEPKRPDTDPDPDTGKYIRSLLMNVSGYIRIVYSKS